MDVCRTGTWTDAQSREVTVTEADFDAMVAAHGGQDPVPVVVGHPETDAPAYAWIDGLRRTGDRLQAKLRDIMPEFRAAVEAGRYAGRSIAVYQGKLRHVGFLGGRAPAVPGLAPTRFSGEADKIVTLAAEDLTTRRGTRFIARAMARLMRGLREKVIAEDGLEAADASFPSWDIDHLNSIADDLDDADTPIFSAPNMEDEPVVPKPEDKNSPKTPKTPKTPDAADLAAREADLDAREAKLAVQEDKAAADAQLAACERLLDPHVTAGRILPAEKAGLAALLASLPDDDGTITFASGDDDGEVSKKPRAVLEDLFKALPKRVEYSELAGGPVPPLPGDNPDADHEGIAAEARTMMSEAEARGEILTAVDAVDRVRAKRGLPRT